MKKKEKNSQLLDWETWGGGGAMRQQSERSTKRFGIWFFIIPFSSAQSYSPISFNEAKRKLPREKCITRSFKPKDGGRNKYFILKKIYIQYISTQLGTSFCHFKANDLSFLFSFCPYKSRYGYFTKKHSPILLNWLSKGKKRQCWCLFLFYWLQFQLRKRNRCDSSFQINRFSSNKKRRNILEKKKNEQISRKQHFKYAAWVVFFNSPSVVANDAHGILNDFKDTHQIVHYGEWIRNPCSARRSEL